MSSLVSADIRAAGLVAFPPGGEAATPALLLQRGCALRPADSSDLPFLRALYGAVRADELAAIPWSQPQKQAFLDSQFALQHHHYVTQFPAAGFWLIEQHATPVGRFYLLNEAPDFLIIDISLLPQWRGIGIGGALIADAQQAAQAAGAGVKLHVAQRNAAARRLYQRLGFVASGQDGPYAEMRWADSTGNAGGQLKTA